MAEELVSGAFWEFVKDELPEEPIIGPKGGRRPIGNRQALTGILFVLRYGCTWQGIPKELGCGSGSTCWRRFRDWTAGGVWQRLQEKVLVAMRDAEALRGCLCVIDSASVRALLGGHIPGPTPRTGPRPGPSGT